MEVEDKKPQPPLGLSHLIQETHTPLLRIFSRNPFIMNILRGPNSITQTKKEFPQKARGRGGTRNPVKSRRNPPITPPAAPESHHERPTQEPTSQDLGHPTHHRSRLHLGRAGQSPAQLQRTQPRHLRLSVNSRESASSSPSKSESQAPYRVPGACARWS